MPIQLLTGKRVFVFGCLRGKVVYSCEPGVLPKGIDGAGTLWGVASADEVQIIKNEAAQLLGRSKAGKSEVKSDTKAKAARINGAMPPRFGSRPRGRPGNGLARPH